MVCRRKHFTIFHAIRRTWAAEHRRVNSRRFHWFVAFVTQNEVGVKITQSDMILFYYIVIQMLIQPEVDLGIK